LSEVLQKYLPEHSVAHCFELIKDNHVHLKIVNERITRHGDYRKDAQGYHLITVNASLNKYRFLMTLIHEIAHLVAFEKYGRRIKPHGEEWKITFQRLMVPFIRPEIFPHQLLPLLAKHLKLVLDDCICFNPMQKLNCCRINVSVKINKFRIKK